MLPCLPLIDAEAFVTHAMNNLMPDRKMMVSHMVPTAHDFVVCERRLRENMQPALPWQLRVCKRRFIRIEVTSAPAQARRRATLQSPSRFDRMKLDEFSGIFKRVNITDILCRPSATHVENTSCYTQSCGQYICRLTPGRPRRLNRLNHAKLAKCRHKPSQASPCQLRKRLQSHESFQ